MSITFLKAEHVYIEMGIRDGNVCDEKQWPQIKNEIYGRMK